METMPPYLSIIIVIVCFLASFIFTAAENAFSNCNIYHYKDLAEDGNFTAKAWGCDLSYDYVKINGDYRS